MKGTLIKRVLLVRARNSTSFCCKLLRKVLASLKGITWRCFHVAALHCFAEFASAVARIAGAVFLVARAAGSAAGAAIKAFTAAQHAAGARRRTA